MENFATTITKTLLLLFGHFFPKQLTNLINYSFWMTIMSSFRLKTYFNGSFQLSVSILTNILVIFLQHLLKIRMISSPVKQTNENTQQQIQSHLKKVDVSRFPVVSNEATKELNSVAVNKHSQNTPLLHKTVNERTVLPSWCQCRHLENILKQMAPQELDKVPEYWVLRRGHKNKRGW